MQISTGALSPQVLAQLQKVDDAGRETQAYVDEEGGLPLRCCLRRSEPGDLVALVSYAPLRRWAAATGVDPGAYVEIGPIFIHAAECTGPGEVNELAAGSRVVRAYDHLGRISGGIQVPGADAAAAAATLLSDADVALVHVRAVEFGCFMYEMARS